MTFHSELEVLESDAGTGEFEICEGASEDGDTGAWTDCFEDENVGLEEDWDGLVSDPVAYATEWWGCPDCCAEVVRTRAEYEGVVVVGGDDVAVGPDLVAQFCGKG